MFENLLTVDLILNYVRRLTMVSEKEITLVKICTVTKFDKVRMLNVDK